MSESDDQCLLAKAEAFHSIAAEWLRADNSERANAAFAKARELAGSVQSLPIGKVSVLASIAEAESAGGLAATSQETLANTLQIAAHLPLASLPAGQRRSATLVPLASATCRCGDTPICSTSPRNSSASDPTS